MALSFRSAQAPGLQARQCRAFKPISAAAKAPARATRVCTTRESHPDACNPEALGRRALLLSVSGIASLASLESFAPQAQAFVQAPLGYRLLVDKIDGYNFLYPETWLNITSSGNDIFLRNPRYVDANVFIEISSASSSKYNSVADLGTPEVAAKVILDRYLTKEFMSTRLGISRFGEVLSAEARTASDGELYYDIAIKMSSYGSRSAYLTTNAEVMKTYGIEWDRVLITTLGVANKRLYELRQQVPSELYVSGKPEIDYIKASFECKTVEPYYN